MPAYGLDHSNHHPKEHGTGQGHHFGHRDHGRLPVSHEDLNPPPPAPPSPTYNNPGTSPEPPPA